VGNQPDRQTESTRSDPETGAAFQGGKILTLRAETGLRRVKTLFSGPAILAGLITLAFFLILLLGSHPGYEADDDISMILLASGYLGGKAVPFLVFSNTLWGFLLNLLYRLTTRWNWEVLIFLLLNFVSVFSLIYLILSRSSRGLAKAIPIVIVLLTDVFFLENINFTSMAALITLAGFCLLLSTLHSRSHVRFGLLILGITWIVIGSLIRIEAALLVVLLLLAPLGLKARSFNIKNLTIAVVATGVLVASCVLFDRFYVSSSPAWSSYYQYNQARSNLHDTPRLAQIDGAIQKVGWSQNDLVMFTHWFFPDPATYSLAHLQVLVESVPAVHTDWIATWEVLLRGLLAPDAFPYILLCAAIWLAAWRSSVAKHTLLPMSALTVIFIGIAYCLEWTAKLPDRVLMSMLASTVVIGLAVLDWSIEDTMANASPASRSLLAPWAGSYITILLVTAAAVLVAVQTVETSRLHLEQQIAYRQILFDLNDLQEDGIVQKVALIVSPSSGIPLEWSNPLVLDLPTIQYLPLGWLTFSPAYEAVLHQYGVVSLPAGFWLKDNIYLMTRSNLMYGIRKFIREHGGPNTTTQSMYTLPSNGMGGSYQNVTLFRFVVKKQ
jgi:hypothetical protein